mmetsp:Transcript_115129/g.298527  ORF Transcript_115129/g.298527 Transcript_115129/m.298527 type:complete len:194 (-) Transcript_115129:235-816(-)
MVTAIFRHRPRGGRPLVAAFAACSALALLTGAPPLAVVPQAPLPPKRAVNAYIFYAQQRRPKLLKEKPELSLPELNIRMGEEWRKLDESDKRQFNAKAAKDKRRYERQLKRYKQEWGEPPRISRRLNKDGTPRKRRAPVAFNMFVQEQMELIMAQMNLTKASDGMKVLANRWEGMSSWKRAKYKKLAQAATSG